jgi:hypothetical protein
MKRSVLMEDLEFFFFQVNSRLENLNYEMDKLRDFQMTRILFHITKGVDITRDG